MVAGKEPERRRPPLFARGFDGSLKPADEADIGDVWAQQGRIRLSEAIEADNPKSDRKHGRKLGRRATVADKPSSSKTNQNKANVDPRTIEINISMPSMGLIRRLFDHILRLPSVIGHGLMHFKRSVGLTFASILVVMLLLVGYNLVFNRDNSGKSTDSSSSSGGVASIKGAPPFNTILPSDKSIQQLGGWGRVSPKDRDPVYAYQDKINSIKINVSEQPLPKNFRDNPAGSVAKLAEQFSANQQIHADDATVYIGNSTSGVQSIVMTKKDLLILIRSDGQIPDETWADYINSLR